VRLVAGMRVWLLFELNKVFSRHAVAFPPMAQQAG
jgi:hypothetical protein